MTTEGKKGGVAALLPMMAGFFVMGFADIVGTVVNQVKSECSLDDVTAGFLPSMIFVWFFLISLPAGVLSGRVGRKNTVLLSLAVTCSPQVRSSSASSRILASNCPPPLQT